MTPSVPNHLNPIQWHQALAVSRQTCARVFRDGGTPVQALASFGLSGGLAGSDEINWDKAVDMIAEELCAHPVAKAA
jgi:hypothetical protein